MSRVFQVEVPDALGADLDRIAGRELRQTEDYIAAELHHIVYGRCRPEDRVTDEELAEFIASRKKNPRITLTAKQRNQIYERCEGKCVYCAGAILFNEVFHIDHIVPVSKGGTNDDANLTLSCVRCNIQKRDKLVAVK